MDHTCPFTPPHPRCLMHALSNEVLEKGHSASPVMKVSYMQLGWLTRAACRPFAQLLPSQGLSHAVHQLPHGLTRHVEQLRLIWQLPLPPAFERIQPRPLIVRTTVPTGPTGRGFPLEASNTACISVCRLPSGADQGSLMACKDKPSMMFCVFIHRERPAYRCRYRIRLS